MNIADYQPGNTVFEGRLCAGHGKEITLGEQYRSDNIRPVPIDDEFLEKHDLKPGRVEKIKKKFEPEMDAYYFEGCDYPFRYKHEIENHFQL